MANLSTTGKTPWTKPQLIVLVRNAPEEAVLFVCKNLSYTGIDNTLYANCQSVGPPACINCNSVLAS